MFQVWARGSKGFRITSPRARVVEAREVSAVGVGDHRAVAAGECALEQFADRRRLAGAGGADHLEVLGFVHRRDGDAGEGQGVCALPCSSSSTASLLQARAVFDAGAALVGEVGFRSAGRETAEVAEQHQRHETDEFEAARGEQVRCPAHE